jgi:hypothetical protein
MMLSRESASLILVGFMLVVHHMSHVAASMLVLLVGFMFVIHT